MKFNIYGVQITLEKIPNSIKNVFLKEWFYFSDKKLKVQLEILVKFVEILEKDEERVRLSKKIEIDKETSVVYLNMSKGSMALDLNTIKNKKIIIYADKTIDGIGLFKILEKILMVKIVELNKVMCHSSSFVCEEKTILVSSFRGGGKTSFLLDSFNSRGFKFLADDLAFLNGRGEVFSYPRGISLTCYQNKMFYKYLFKEKYKKILKESFKIIFLKMKILNRKPCIRVSPRDIFGYSKIADKSQLTNIFLLEQGGNKEVKEVSKEEAIAFLNTNINLERGEEFYYELKMLKEMIPLYKDFFDYIKEIDVKQKIIFSDVVEKCKVNKIILPKKFYKVRSILERNILKESKSE